MVNYENIWKQALVELKKIVTSVSYDLWISSLSPISYIDGKLYLSTTSGSAKQRTLELHEKVIKEVLNKLNTEVKEFEILDPYDKEIFLAKEKELTDLKEAENRNNTFNKKYTLDNFIVGNSNKYVYAAMSGVAKEPFKINPLFIYGGTGLGKTHLLNAVGNYLAEHSPQLKVVYVTCEKFTNDYIDSLKSGKNDYNDVFRLKYRNADVLMIDDIQFISKRTGTQEEFFHTFNDLYNAGKQIIITSDRPPKEISTLEERLVSRFSMGIIQDIQTPDLETRIAILQNKAKSENYQISDEVINFIAENYDTNIRELEGVLGKVHFFATLQSKDVADMEDVQEALKDHISSNKQNITPESIIDCVCKYFSVAKADIVGKKKNKEIVEPRQISMYLIYDILDLPLTSIGQVFGGRDHTTVIHARDKVEELIKENNRIKTAVSDIRSMAKKV